jgi:hypothetical protein
MYPITEPSLAKPLGEIDGRRRSFVKERVCPESCETSPDAVWTREITDRALECSNLYEGACREFSFV